MAAVLVVEMPASPGGVSTMAGGLTAPSSPLTIRAKSTRLPREGPTTGGGTLTVHDRSKVGEIGQLGQRLDEAGLEESQMSWGAPSKRRGALGHRTESQQTIRTNITDPTAPPRSADREQRSARSLAEAAGEEEADPMVRRQAEMKAKWDKVEATRSKDCKVVHDRLSRQHEMREARFQRLLRGVSGRNDVGYQTAVALRESSDRQDLRRRQLHSEMEEKVFEPMALQVHKHLNPPNRLLEQYYRGSKSVEFEPPLGSFKLNANLAEDPVKRELVETARENAFHQAAEALLGRRTNSAPNLHSERHPPKAPGGPKAQLAFGRSIMEPTKWSQVALQGTLSGHFAQVAEHGPGFKRARRGGGGVHCPNEEDGIPAAGTMRHRIFGHHYKGVLVGDRGSLGETSDWKTALGQSSGAPNQDHYTYQTGPEVTNLEYPLGKRSFPEIHHVIH